MKIYNLLSDILNELRKISAELNRLNKTAISLSGEPKAWLSDEKREEAKELRQKSPEQFDFVCEILKCFFT